MRTIGIALAFLVSQSPLAFGQDRAADEKAIRELIVKFDAGGAFAGLKPLPDRVAWSGAMVRPTVGAETPELRPGSSAVPGGRTDQKVTTKVAQLKVAAAGDMAYEYSNFHSSYIRTRDKQKVEFDGAILRVWTKVDGMWRIAASFQHPFDNSPSTR